MVSKKIKEIMKSNKRSMQHKWYLHVIKQIRNIVTQNNLVVCWVMFHLRLLACPVYISSAVYRSILCISVFSGLKCMACCCWTNSLQASSLKPVFNGSVVWQQLN
jgi:hypothetical protein